MAQSTNPAIPAVEVPDQKQGQAGSTVPFMKATTLRIVQAPPTTLPLTASQQAVSVDLPSGGYIEGVDLITTITATNDASTTTVTAHEDAPYSVFANLSLSDTRGPSINLTSGYNLYLANLFGCPNYGMRYDQAVQVPATIPASLFSPVSTGTGATKGSAKFVLRVPVAYNDRTGDGALGNQAAGLTYTLVNDIAPSAALYGTTAPVSGATVSVIRCYRNWAKPAAKNAQGANQAQEPQRYGIIHYLSDIRNGVLPAPGTVQFPLPQTAHVWRQIIGVLRQNGSRASAETNHPLFVSFTIGSMPVYENIPWEELRYDMFKSFGIPAPDGVFVLDFTRDAGNYVSGNEFGWNYVYAQGLTAGSTYVSLTFPSGIGSTNNSLTFIFDELAIPDSIRMP